VTERTGPCGSPTPLGSIGRITTGRPEPAVAVTATPGNGGHRVVGAPLAPGLPVTGYTITASPGGGTCTWTTGPLSCVVTGLTNNTPYTFRATATNSAGTSSLSAPSAPVTPTFAAGYHPLTPSRILDSRTSTGGWSGPLIVGVPRQLQVTGLGGASNVPATAAAVVMNVTATGGSIGSFVTIHPAGTPIPNASNLNYGAGQTIANLVTVRLGTAGRVAFTTPLGACTSSPMSSATTTAPAPATCSRHHPGAPARFARPPAGGGPTERGHAAICAPARQCRWCRRRQPPSWRTSPSPDPRTAASCRGPSGVTQPGVSNLNFARGQTIPNLAIVKIGANGAIRFANAVGGVDVIVDVVGYFDPTAGGSRFHPIDPTRVLDDRDGTGLSGPWTAGQTRALSVAGAAGTNVPAGATGLVANVTATNASTGSFVTVFPDGVAVPTASNLNFGAGETIPNLVTTKVGANGRVAFFNKLGTVDLVADAVGYYAP
jgi:hypothetical protein